MNSKQIKPTLKQIFQLLMSDKLLISIIFLISLISAGSIIAASYFVGFTIQSFVQLVYNNSKEMFIRMVVQCCITIGLYLIYWFANSFILSKAVKLSHKLGSNLRYKVFVKLNSVHISFIDQNKVGELLSRATGDVDMFILNISQILSSAFMSPLIIIAAVITIIITSPLLALISLVLMIIIFLITSFVAKRSAPNFNKMQDQLGQMNDLNQEYLDNKMVIYMFQRQKKISKKFKELNLSHAHQASQAEYRVGMVYPILDILENIMYGVIYIIGFIFIMYNIPTGSITSINVGTLATFVVLVRLANGEIGNVARFASIINKTLACAYRVFDIINQPNDSDPGFIKEFIPKGEIVFDNVNFSYDGKTKIIKNFNLKIQPGQKVAIVGPTGSGKTTLINLIMRFYEISDGKILIDGINIKDIEKPELRKNISIVLQETSLFSETIKTNISYGHHNEEVDDSKINDSAQKIGSLHFINILPHGMNTTISEHQEISTGEAQLLALTRAHYSPSNILILDEATSSIDTMTEHIVQKGMQELMKNKTTIVIAHRLSTIVNSDLIIAMKDGQIVEQGNHQELINKKGFYYNLYNSHQLETEE